MPISMSIKLPHKKINKAIIEKFYILATNFMISNGISDIRQIIQQVSINNDKSIIFDFRSFEELNKEILLNDRVTSIIYTFYTSESNSSISKLTFSHFIHEFTLLEVEASVKALAEKVLLDFKDGLTSKDTPHVSNQIVQNMVNNDKKPIFFNDNEDDSKQNIKTEIPKWLLLISTIIAIIAGIVTILEFVL